MQKPIYIRYLDKGDLPAIAAMEEQGGVANTVKSSNSSSQSDSCLGNVKFDATFSLSKRLIDRACKRVFHTAGSRDGRGKKEDNHERTWQRAKN